MKLYNYFVILGCALILSNCYPQEDYIATADLDTIVTFKPESANMTGKTTFAVTEVVWNDEYDDYDSTYNTTLVAQIEKNMEELGYTLLKNPSDQNVPDIAIIPEIIFTNNYVVGGGGCYYGCWGWGWGGGWYGGWGYGPYYPTYAYSYSSGSILMHMIDTSITTENTQNVLWNGAIDGLLRSNLQHSLLNSYVDQAFEQSADYLSK